MIKHNIYYLLLILILFSCSWKKNSVDYGYIPIKSGDKWGFVNPSGKYLINPQFINNNNLDYGQNIVSKFYDGLALAIDPNGKYGYINKNGTYTINPRYRNATNFSEGIAIVCDPDSFLIAINSDGNRIFSLPDVLMCGVFKSGLAPVKLKNKQWGFINKKGVLAISAHYYDANLFEDNLAKIKTDSVKEEYGYIDKDGKIVITPQFKEASDFSGGLAKVKIGDKFGFINKEGKVEINPQFDEAGSFSEDMAFFKSGSKYGYIGMDGKFQINPQFDAAKDFKNGMGAVKSGDKWGFVDKAGKLIINPQYDEVSDFFGDVASIKIDNKYGFINKDGKMEVTPQFDNCGISNDFINYINSDYWDVLPDLSIIMDRVLEFSKNHTGLINTLEEVRNSPFSLQFRLKSDGKNVAIIKTKSYNLIHPEIDSCEFYFKDPIFLRIPEYASNGWFKEVSGYKEEINGKSELLTMMLYISMPYWGPAHGKSEKLAIALKDDILKKYDSSHFVKKTQNEFSSDNYIQIESENCKWFIATNGKNKVIIQCNRLQ